jgi:hypothetical protein
MYDKEMKMSTRKIHDDPSNVELTYRGQPVTVDSVFIEGCTVVTPALSIYGKCGHTFGYIRRGNHGPCGTDAPIMHSRPMRADEVHTLGVGNCC